METTASPKYCTRLATLSNQIDPFSMPFLSALPQFNSWLIVFEWLAGSNSHVFSGGA
jgi:hypothetical protein